MPTADVGSGITPSDGATLTFTQTGTDTPKDTFTTEAATVASSNPVIADASGVFADIFLTGTYRVRLKDKNGVQTGFGVADPVEELALASDTPSVALNDERYGPIFATVAAMTAANPVSVDGKVVIPVAGMSVEIQGYFTSGDGGGKKGIIVASQAADEFGDHTLDNGTVFVLSVNNVINAVMFGIIGGASQEKDRADALYLRSKNLSLPVNFSQGVTSTSSLEAQRLSYSEKNITNVVPNGRFHWWRRLDARGTTGISYVAPTFGDAATYDGTGGLKVYGPDMWSGKMFGKIGDGSLDRISPSGTGRESTDSQAFVRWIATSTVPPASVFDFSPTNVTSFAVSPVVVSQVAHGLINGDFVWWDNASYNGGSFAESTFTVSNVTADTFELAITPDAGFTSWISFGDMTDDPDATGFQHIHDPVLGTIRRSWIRNGTAGQELINRRPHDRASGSYTCRVRGKHVSGNGNFFIRIFQNMGENGTANTSTTLPGMDFAADGGGVKEFVLPIDLPDMSSFTFGQGSFLQVSLVSADPELSHHIEVTEIDLYQGDNLLQQADTDHNKELPLLERFYRTERAGFLAPVESGRFYGINVTFTGQPMAGVPTPTVLSTPVSANLAFSSNSAISVYGLTHTVEADATVTVGQYVAILEMEYVIPTSFVGD
jgi:hypothetical protein